MLYIIADDDSILTAMELLMHSAGFDALAFSSAGEFLKRVTLLSNDCIILDLCMPDMDGFELLKTRINLYCHSE
jgi:FixJ family two-component response regulator